MKRLVLLLVLIIALSIVHAQNRVFQCSTGRENQYLCLSLMDSRHEYVLYLKFEDDDLYWLDFLSFGSFMLKGRYIILSDKINGTKWDLIEDGNGNYMVKQGFCSFKNKTLNYCYESKEALVIPDIQLDDIQLKREVYKTQTAMQEWDSSYWDNVAKNYGLTLNGDRTYSFSFSHTQYAMPISSGVWKRQGNLITFCDNCLGDAFYLLMEEGVAISFFVPCLPLGKKIRMIPDNENDYLFPPITREEFDRYLDSIQVSKPPQGQ